MARRPGHAWQGRSGYAEDGSIPRPILLFQELVHTPGIYDLEVDDLAADAGAEASAEAIRLRLDVGGPPRLPGAAAAGGRGLTPGARAATLATDQTAGRSRSHLRVRARKVRAPRRQGGG